MPTALAAHPAHRGRAAHSKVEHGAARLLLVLDMRRRRGEVNASGAPWGEGLGNNRYTMHCVTPYDAAEERRVIHRTIVKGDVPV